MTTTALHPDWVTLTDRVARLKEGLDLLLEEESRLLLQEQPVLFAEYQAALGALDLDLLVLEAECATLRYRIERITARQNRGEAINADWLARLDQDLAQEQAAWAERLAAREAELAKGLAGYLGLGPVDPVIYARCKQAYRRLVRLLHPDVTQNPEASRRYWQAVQETSRGWDADALRQRQTALLERIPFQGREIELLVTYIAGMEHHNSGEEARALPLEGSAPCGANPTTPMTSAPSPCTGRAGASATSRVDPTRFWLP